MTDCCDTGVIYAPYIPITTGTICNGKLKEYKTEAELRLANPQVSLEVIKEIVKKEQKFINLETGVIIL